MWTLPRAGIDRMSPSMNVCTLSRVWLFVTLWTVTHQAPLPTVFSREEYLNGLSFPPPGGPPNPGIEPVSPASPALVGRFLFTAPSRKSCSLFFNDFFCHHHLLKSIDLVSIVHHRDIGPFCLPIYQLIHWGCFQGWTITNVAAIHICVDTCWFLWGKSRSGIASLTF